MRQGQLCQGLISKTIQRFLVEPTHAEDAATRFTADVPNEIRALVEQIISTKELSYRDALIIQLAYAITADKHLDITKRHEGARGVAKNLGAFMRTNHIGAVADAFQNIGKNVDNLTRGNFEAFDSFLKWASEEDRGKDLYEVIFNYACARIAATSRNVRPLPEINLSKMTYGTTFDIIERLFSLGSQGAYEQFTVAALLSAFIVQAGENKLRVETKNLNASDKSSRTAGDVQILMGNRIVEAYEVTAKNWIEKIPGVETAIRDNDLSRIHIIATAPANEAKTILTELSKLRDDVSVIDIRAFSSTLLSALTRQFRAQALERLYHFLDRYQPDVEKVNQFVELLESSSVTIPKATTEKT